MLARERRQEDWRWFRKRRQGDWCWFARENRETGAGSREKTGSLALVSRERDRENLAGFVRDGKQERLVS